MNTADQARPARVRQTPSWLLTQTATRAHRLVSTALTGAGSHQYQYLLLSALAEFGPTSQASLARHSGLDRSDVVALVNTLVNQELVDRAVDSTNRRRNLITLNRRGTTKLRQLDRTLADVQDELLAPLGTTARADLVRLLTRVLDHHSGENDGWSGSGPAVARKPGGPGGREPC